ncbi:MAG: isochorismate synthase [Coleofasciculaceae cyanobacterium RL_1_1]|nr:isochorismate synthase [Coleofasciculaceae cyanobacterium RL_1_1]
MYSERWASASELATACNDDTSFFLATPTQTLFAEGIRARLPNSSSAIDTSDLPQRAREFLQQQMQNYWCPTLLVGAIPFDDSAAINLFVPGCLHRAQPLTSPAAVSGLGLSCPSRSVAIPDPATYQDNVVQALAQIDQSELLKVVLSRSLELSFPDAIDFGQLIGNLTNSNRHGYTYLIDLAEALDRDASLTSAVTGTSPGHTPHKLIGASPELLIRRRGLQVEANPLAGSVALTGDPERDCQQAYALLNSKKDRHEHAVVVEAVADALHPFCDDLDVPPIPSIIETDTMMHLSTQIRGNLRNPEICALSVALALHPTPAVCGAPPNRAYDAIQAIESFSRRYFTGMVGWMDDRGDGEWAVTIRCGEARGRCLRLYAGAGVVAGSSPEKELAETSAKLRTMLKALGLTDLLEVAA